MRRGRESVNCIAMAVRILTDEENGLQVMYASDTMSPFGPVHNNHDHDLNEFIEWLDKDARKYSTTELNRLYYQWLESEKLLETLTEE